MGRGWKNVDPCDRKSIDCLTQTVGKKINVKSAFGKHFAQEGLGNILLEARGNVDPCQVAANVLSELSPTVAWKVEFVSDELGYLTEISTQSIGGMAQLLPALI